MFDVDDRKSWDAIVAEEFERASVKRPLDIAEQSPPIGERCRNRASRACASGANTTLKAFSRPTVSYVRGTDGSALSLSDLPTTNSGRWARRHKVNVVAAVRGGLVSLEDVCLRYGMTTEEFLSWSLAVDGRSEIHAVECTLRT